MAAFRVLLVAILAIISIYTGITVANHGLWLLPVFFGDMANMGWPGQFNLDFMFMLTLAACWVAWRHRFSGKGLGLALLTLSFGSMFLAIYLLVLIRQAQGNMREVLLGKTRATALA